eukprot:CAMPEP_0184487832 /NCGR_PEP_ID=MMETSP0113_2-20130426/10361_1 /TAXON_ID=91329 /ORGANISM="Norrisiella sphaerica, Strain BC52" /LENGTH=383 /DNA_ID=CAMNT_0026870243 /DNA_START=65 /DNA_END=1216 /DNA_ORIENTATION=-
MATKIDSYQRAPDFPSNLGGSDVKIKVTIFEYKAGGGRADDAITANVFMAPSRTVKSLKSAVRSQHGFLEQNQTAIYKGQVLHDTFILSNIPGLCGEDGSTPHVRIVIRSDVESQNSGAFGGSFVQDDPSVSKAHAPPPGYFQQQSIYRRSHSGSFNARDNMYMFPRDLSDETELVKKVYSALSVQMLVTFVVSAMFMFYQPVNTFVMQHQMAVYYGSFFVSIITLLGLFCYKASYPTNMYMLVGFTLAMSCEVGVICALYAQAGMAEIVLQAVIYTSAIFGALTIYAFTTRIDLRSWGPYLFVGLIVLMIWGFVSMLFGFQSNWFYSLAGALLFSAYILYDTSRLLHTYGSDESWILFTIDLYLDIINLFLFILQLLAKDRD